MVETGQTQVISPPGSWLCSDRRDHPLRPAAGLQHTGWFPTGGGEADGCGFAPDDKHHENNGSPEGRGPSAQTPAGRGAGHVGADEEIRFAPCTLPSTGWLMEALDHLVPFPQGCRGSSRTPTYVVFTLRTGYFWTKSATEASWRWVSRGSRLPPPPRFLFLAPSTRFRPCSLLSSCCGASRPTCLSLWVEWLSREGGRGADRWRETMAELNQKCTF